MLNKETVDKQPIGFMRFFSSNEGFSQTHKSIWKKSNNNNNTTTDSANTLSKYIQFRSYKNGAARDKHGETKANNR